jgi:putative transposase
LQNTYTRRHNCRHRLWGRLFGDRYKAILSDGGSDYYYCSLMDYIHLNPVRAGLVRMKRGESVRDYLWSSVAKGYAVAPSRRPIWLAAEEGLAMAQCADTAVGRRRFVQHLDNRAREEGIRAGVIEPGEDRRYSHLRHGWSDGDYPPALRTVMRTLTRQKRALFKVICVGYYWLHEEQIRRKLQARVVRLLSWYIAQCHHCLGVE